MDNLQKLKREQAILKGQLDTLNGRMMAGERTLRAQVTSVSRQLARIEERIQAQAGEKASDV